MKLSKKLMLLGIIPSLLFFLVSIFYIIPDVKNIIYDEKDVQIREQVENVYSIINYYYSLEKEGKMLTQEAQSEAIKTVQAIRFGDNGYLWIDDINLINVIHPVKPELKGKSRENEQDSKGKYFIRELIDGAVKNKNSGYYVDYWFPKPGESKPSLKRSYTKFFEPWNWGISTGMYIDDVEKHVSKSTAIVVIAIAIAAIITILMTYWISKIIIIKPLQKVTDKVDDISEKGGDLTQRIGYSSKDEVGQLSKSFDIFMDKLQSIIKKVSSSAQNVALTSESLVTATIETTSSIQEVSATINEIAKTATEQARNAEIGVGKLNHFSEDINKVARGAERMKDYIDSTSNANLEGMNHINQLVVVVKENTEISQKISMQIAILEESSEAINHIVNAIQSIAEQTNLLALNAAIEAARVGDQGKGFAVVADEIRELSEETSKSTKEIEHIVNGIKVEIKNTKDRIDEGKEVTAKTYKISEDTGKAFNVINEVACNTIKQLEELLQNIQRIDKEKNSIVVAMSEISTLTEESAAATEEVAAATEEQLVSVEEMSKSADDLKEIADNLRDLINQFKF